MVNVLLCIPPCYDYDYPPLGTPMLLGYLKKHSVNVFQTDYNMQYMEFYKKLIFSRTQLVEMSDVFSVGIIQNMFRTIFAKKKNKRYYFAKFLPRYQSGLPYNDNTNSSFSFTEQLLVSEHLFKYIEDVRENTFLKFYLEDGILSQIKEKKTDVIGISIISPSQVIASFTLGFLVKKIEEKGDLSDVPNLIYQNNYRWVHSSCSSKENLDEIYCPDFDGLPLKKYLSYSMRKGSALTYQTARECYWNKCVYCVDLPLPKQGYRERNSQLVLKDIEELINKYDLKFLMISNAVLSPKQLKEISQGILRKKLKFSWWGFLRLEKSLTKYIFDLAKRSGCKTLSFGLESANQRVLNFINKGIDVKIAKRVITDCFLSGIKVQLQMMIGLPGETMEEALDTVKFLVENRIHISDVIFNIYYLTPACEVYLNPERYGISYKKSKKSAFDFFYAFTGDLSTYNARAIIDLYNKMISIRHNSSEQEGIEMVDDDLNSTRKKSMCTLNFSLGKESVSKKVFYRHINGKVIGIERIQIQNKNKGYLQNNFKI